MKHSSTFKTVFSVAALAGAMALCVSGNALAAASASAPAKGPVDTVKDASVGAAKSTNAAITKAGKAVDSKVPRTEAYKKSLKKKKAPKVQEQRN